MKKLCLSFVGLLVLGFVVYNPISLFCTDLPPFGSYNKTVYTYNKIEGIGSVYALPGIVAPEDRTLQSTKVIVDPAKYGYELESVDKHAPSPSVVLLSAFVEALLFFVLLFLFASFMSGVRLSRGVEQ